MFFLKFKIFFSNRNQRKRKIVHGTVTYKRKNISQEAKRLHLDVDIKPKHIFFDEDEDEAPTESKENEIKEQNELSTPCQIFSDDDDEKKKTKTSTEKSDSGSEPEEVPINRNAKSICRSKSLSNLACEQEGFNSLVNAKSCEDSLDTLTGEKKHGHKLDLLEVCIIFV